MGAQRKRRLQRLSLGLLLFGLGTIFGLYFNSPQTSHESKQVSSILKLENKDILHYLEAITRIRDIALFLSEDITREQVVQGTLKAYLDDKDTFSAYLTQEEYSKFRESQAGRYVGIGMEIEKNRFGEIICFPYPESVAERAGIRHGDQLKSIDEIPVAGKSIFTIASLASGREGTSVDLVIKKKSGGDVRLSLIRSVVRFESISKRQVGKLSFLKILSFSSSAKARMVGFLSAWDENSPIVLDLRGNPGGDLDAAVDSAKLFLKRRENVYSIRGRNGIETFASSDDALSPAFPIILWQDETTASAAEIFIAALLENDKAISIGTKTFGKGTKQDIIRLSDGSALVLTTGYLQTPSGEEYDGIGLNPSFELVINNPKIVDYIAKTNALIDSFRGGTAIGF